VVQRVGRGIALLFHDRGTRRRWVVSSTPRPHFTPGKDRVPIVQVKVKVMWSLYKPGVVQRVGRGIALLFHDRDTRRRWVVSSTPQPHFTPGKDPVTILQEAGCAPVSVMKIRYCISLRTKKRFMVTVCAPCNILKRQGRCANFT
jgi:hypothetical protein